MVGTLVALAAVGFAAAGPVSAVASTITVHVLSDTTPQDHVEGVAYDGTGGNAQIPVATFKDTDACPTPTTCQPGTDYSGTTIKWSSAAGDVTTCTVAACVITVTDTTNGIYSIAASHTFKDEFNCQPTPCQNDQITVTVNDTDGQSGAADNFTSLLSDCNPGASSPCLGLAIKDQVLTTTSSPSISGTAASPFSGVVGTFLDANPLAAIADVNLAAEYSVSIDWGDGTGPDTTTGAVSKGACTGAGCQMTVNATHTYAASNVYPVKVTVQDGLDFQFKIVISDTATIANDSGPSCTSASLLPGSSTEFVGKVITFRAGAGPCSAPQYQFWLKSAGGSWVIMQKFSTTNTWTWDTSKWAKGTYYIDVWANQNGVTPTQAQAFALDTITLTQGPACTAVGLASDKATPQQSGTIITFSANPAATPCPYPEYEFWVQASGGPWILGRGYGGPTYVWNTAGNGATDYNVVIWAREKGSTASQQAFSLVSYTLTAPQACTTATLSALPLPPQPSGTTVTFTAGASPCSQPQFLFYVQAQGGPWILGRTWGTSNTYVWKTTGNGKTTYTIDVWVRQNGSTSPHEAFTTTSYVLN